MTEDEAIGILKTMCTDNFCIEQLKTKQAIETILGELEKKDKIIDAMAEYIEEINYIDDNECEFETRHQIECPPTSCKDCTKQYFERKVKDE